MNFTQRVLGFVERPLFFYSVLGINLLLLCTVRFYPTMDGPAHLYNSNLILELLAGNTYLAQFFVLNPPTIPNWISHVFLAFFNYFLPGWVAEKILLLSYVMGMALSFRYMIKQISPKNKEMSVLVFPIIYSYLFLLGFYNFAISFVFLFTAIGFSVKYSRRFSVWNYVLLLFLLTLTFYSNILTFSFLGLTLGSIIIQQSVSEKSKGGISAKLFIRMLALLVVSLPGLIMMTVFFLGVEFKGEIVGYEPELLMKWMNDARPLITYNYSLEEVFTEQYVHVLLILLVLSFVRIKEQKIIFRFQKADVFLVPIVVSVVFLFAMPNSSGAGMMSDRFALIVFVFAIIWIALRSVTSEISKLLVIWVVAIQVFLLVFNLKSQIWEMSSDAKQVYYCEHLIEENSIVLPINLSDHWIEKHLSNYLGADKPMVIMGNYEAVVGWFPVNWNDEEFPRIKFAGKDRVKNLDWQNNRLSNRNDEIDYVFVYGDVLEFSDAKWEQAKAMLDAEFSVIHESDFIQLYQKK